MNCVSPRRLRAMRNCQTSPCGLTCRWHASEKLLQGAAVSCTMRRAIHSTSRFAVMTTSGELLVKPGLQFVLSHPAHLLSFGFGSGLARKAPGTFGTLAAFPMYWYLAPRLSDAMFMLMLAGAFAVGVWACNITGKALGVADYGGLVWGEGGGMLLGLFFSPPGWDWALLAFALFRLF